MARFTYQDHRERMRKLLVPPQIKSPLIERIRMAVRRRKLPNIQEIK